MELPTPPLCTRDQVAFFTICSNNYLPFARLLLDSVRRHHPEAALFLCLADRKVETPGTYGAVWTVVEAQALAIPDFPAFAFRYDIMEFNTALKPFMFLHLLEDRGFTAAIYLDPDIELHAPLAPVLDMLNEGASFVLTPHLLSPNEDRTEPNDLSMLRAGAYNLGFLAAAATAETAELLAWWAHHLRFNCLNAQAEGLFVDQKFMDLVPCFAASAAICHNPALNLAYWNLGQRQLGRAGDGWTVDGAPLVFFHFSGFDPRRPDRLSKHDPRFRGDLPEPLRLLLCDYAERLLGAGYEDAARWSYAYGRFATGTSIHPALRRLFRAQPFWPGDPFQDFEAWVHKPAVTAPRIRPGEAVTNLAAFLGEERGVTLTTPDEARDLLGWFVRDAVTELGLDPPLIEPAAARLAETRPSRRCQVSDAEVAVSVVAPLDRGSDAERVGRGFFAALLAAGVAAELVPAGAKVRSQGVLTLLCKDGGAAPDAYAAGTMRVLVPLGDELSDADEVWAPSRFAQARFAATAPGPVIWMPPPCDVWPIGRSRAQLGLPEKPFLVFAGPADAESALALIRESFPNPGEATLVLAGDGEHPDGDDVLWVRSDRRSVIAHCNAVLILDRHGAAELTAAEAMLQGVPVVATRYGGVRELVTDVTGYPVDYQVTAGAGRPTRIQAVDQLRAIRAGGPALAAKIASARTLIRSQRSREAVAERLQTRLREIGVPLP